MYALPEDRNSPLLAQLARLQAASRPVERSGFGQELLAARNEVAHYAMGGAGRASAGAGLQRRSRLQAFEAR